MLYCSNIGSINKFVQINEMSLQSNKKLALVLPGGGVRGIIQTKLLVALDEILKNKIPNYQGLGKTFDYIAGTSIGGINAINLVVQDQDGNLKYTQTDNMQMFLDNAGKVLKQNSWLSFANTSYSNENIVKLTEERFENKTFKSSDVSAKVLLSSYCLNTTEQTLWTNIGTEEQRTYGKQFVLDIDNVKLCDAAIATSALPKYLPSHKICYDRGWGIAQEYCEVDGGMISNTPILPLLSSIVGMDKVNVSDLCIISIGCGTFEMDMSHVASGGTYTYLSNMAYMMSSHIKSIQDNDNTITERIVKNLGGLCFFVEPTITFNDYMNGMVDSKAQLQHYVNIVDEYVQNNQDYLNDIADAIVQWHG